MPVHKPLATQLCQSMLKNQRRLLRRGALNATAQTPAQVLDERLRVLQSLRRTFASELVLLHEEARAEGLLQSTIEAAEVLRQAKLEQAEKSHRERKIYEQHAQQLQTLTETIRQDSTGMVAAMDTILERLVLTVSIRLLGIHATNASLIKDLAHQAINHYHLQAPLTIHVSASDYALIKHGAATNECLALFQVTPNAAIGSCVIDYGAGWLDAGIVTQLHQLQRELALAFQVFDDER